MLSPKVSFVVPCYKLAHLLQECVESILAQTYEDFEVLIMDDCSPDHTGEVVRSFHDSRIRYIRNDPNLGHLRNYNRGISLALGEYIWLISADDRLRKQYILERYLSVMERHPEVGFAFCPGVGLRDGAETEIVKWAVLDCSDTILPGREFLRCLLHSNCVLAPAGLVRKRCYEQLGAFPLDLPFAGDWYLWCLFSLHYDVAYLSEPMVNYREHGQSMTDILIADDVRRLSIDDLAVRWRIKQKVASAGLAPLVEECRAKIVAYYISAMSSKKWRGAKYRMTLEEFEQSLSAHSNNAQETLDIRRKVLMEIGKHLYWDADFQPDLRLFELALVHGPLNLKLWLKYLILRTGRFAPAIMETASRFYTFARTFRAASITRLAPDRFNRCNIAQDSVGRTIWVCIIAENQSFGGMEVHTLGLMKTLIARGYHIELIANHYYGYDEIIKSRCWDDKVRVIHTEFGGILYGASGSSRQWKHALSCLRSTILIFPRGNSNYGQISFLRACRTFFERIIFIDHSAARPRPRETRHWFGLIPGLSLWWYKRRFLSKRSSRYADHIVAVSRQVRDRLVQDLGYASQKVVVIHNGVEWREFTREAHRGTIFRARHDIPPEAFVFGMLTRLEVQKGIDIAIHAFHKLVMRSQKKGIYLVIAGEGSQISMLKELSYNLGIQRWVRFVGFVQDPKEILSSYDVILFSSRTEGLPLALLEGMAAGCIPIVTRISGMPEAVDSPDIGWVVAPEDPAELSEAMGSALSLDEAAIAKMRINALERVQNAFYIEKCHASILGLCGL
jgi:glycosyltransferase involved in cell wall biosynthesis